MENKPRILLTGATGFLGSRILESLLSDSYPVVILKRLQSNLRRIEGLFNQVTAIYNLEEDGIARAFDEQSIEIVIHCATDYGRKNTDALQIVQANLILPLCLLHEGKKHGLKIFINTDTLLDKRINEYSLSKRQFSEWLQSSAGNLVCIDVALEHFYGPDDDTSKFVSWLLDNFLKGTKNLALTAGEQKRDFIYIDDVVNAFMVILRKSLSFEVGYKRIEVGTGKTTAIRDLVQILSELCHPHLTSLDFGFLPYRVHEVMDSKVDLTALQNLGWSPKLSLYEGLSRMVEQERRLRKLRL